MRTTAPLLLASFLAACTGQTDDPTIVPGIVPTTTPVPDDTGWPPGDLANFHLAYHVNSDKAEVVAVASESQPGFLNFAQCAVKGVPCLGGIPNGDDDYVDLDLGQDVDRETITTRFLGFEVSFGPYVLQYREDPETHFGFYGSIVDYDDLPVDRWIAPSWGGQWGEYKGDKDLFVSRPIEVLNPAPGQDVVFTNGENVQLEWVPTGEGEVTLLVNTRYSFARMFHLEDDGYFELVADDLGLTNDQEELTFTFARWNIETLRKFGHVIDITASSDVTFTGQYYNIGNRDRIDPSDDCTEAAGLPSLTTGNYWGWLGSKDGDYTVNGACLDPAGQNVNGPSANGKDGVVRVDVAPLQLLTADYNVYDDSASVYLVTDCDNTNGTCLDGSDLDGAKGAHEYASWFNLSDDYQSVYVMLDEAEETNSIFTLDLTVEPVPAPDMYDNCQGVGGAESAAPSVVAGNYYSAQTPWTNSMNPGAGGCTGTSLEGADAMTPIEVPAGATLTVSVTMAEDSGADPGLYLLRNNCTTPFGTCLAGMDASIDNFETVSWTNTGAATERVYFVLDTASGPSPYWMNVSIK